MKQYKRKKRFVSCSVCQVLPLTCLFSPNPGGAVFSRHRFFAGGLALFFSFLWTMLSQAQAEGTSSGQPMAAQTEKIVVTATMTEKIAKEAPGSIEVVTGRDILEMNAQTVAEALEEATGLVVSTETGRQKGLMIRGTSAKHALVLIDGRRLASGFKDFLGLEQISPDLIDRIEVVRGPASALYGSDAIGGVVNIITKKPPKELDMGLTAQYGASKYGEGQETVGRVFAGNSAGPFGFLLSGSLLRKNGYDRDGVTPDDGDDIDLKSTSGRFSYDMSEKHRLSAGFEFDSRNTEGLRDMENMDRERDADDQRLNYYMQYDGKITPYRRLMLMVNHSEHENDIDICPPTDPISGAIGDELNAKRDLDQVEGRFTGLFFDRHIVTVGAEYREEGREDDSGLDDDIDNLGFYAQDEYQIVQPLVLVLGVRWDEHSDFGSEWTPRAAVTYGVLDNLRLKASYGKGFKAPGLIELYVPTYMKRGKEVYEPNPDLDPEKSDSWEIGVEGEYATFQASIVWFRNEIEELIEPVFYKSEGKGKSKVDYYRYENIAEAKTTGIELMWSWGLPKGFALSGNFSWLDTENEETGDELEGRPDCKGSLKLRYEHPGAGVCANLRANYVGDTHYEEEDEDHFTTVDAYVSKEVSKNLELFAGIDNIFNAKRDYTVAPTFYYAGIRLGY